MKSAIQILQDEITPYTLGVFWITPSPLTKDTPLTREFDYFTNGQISNFLKTKSPEEKKFTKNIFIQKSFGEDTFICHLQDVLSERAESLMQLKSLIDSVKTERNELVLINTTSHDYSLELKKLYPKLTIRCIKI
ncbi:MAG: hypothetical protein KAG61_14185 [Bacteriovoracaceae bacterium]|nr:hypothetical protein [Bacteriovoracaceae bacterium]